MTKLLILTVILSVCLYVAASDTSINFNFEGMIPAKPCCGNAEPCKPCDPCDECEPCPEPETRGYNFDVIVHGTGETGFWRVVKNGFTQAAQDLGVNLNFQGFDQGEADFVQQMSDALTAVISSGSQGLAISVPSPALVPLIEAAISTGIPVVTLNSGAGLVTSQATNYLAHYGQDETEAGSLAGSRAWEFVNSAEIFVTNSENVGLQARASGFASGFYGEAIASVVTPAQLSSSIAASVSELIVVVAGDDSEVGFAAAKAAGKKFVAFDLTTPVLGDLVAGGETTLFAVDQQPFLQGYNPVKDLTLYLDNASTPGSRFYATGPGFVTTENAAAILALVASGRR